MFTVAEGKLAGALSSDLSLPCPTNNVNTPSATHRASNVYAFLTVSKPRTLGFQTCRTSLRSRFNKPKSRFSCTLRPTSDRCAVLPLFDHTPSPASCISPYKPYAALYAIRHAHQTALRLFKAHAAVSSRLPPAHSNDIAPDHTALTSIDKPFCTALSAVEQ